jgi:hypothetical protein
VSKKKGTVTVSWSHFGLEIVAEVDVEYLPGRPAQTYGPPEDCHTGDAAELCRIVGAVICEVDGVRMVTDAVLTTKVQDFLWPLIEAELNEGRVEPYL